MDYICTWFCADTRGEESSYLQSGEISSSPKHHNIYWRCIGVFFATSLFFNQSKKHVLFTNVRDLPILEDFNLSELLKEMGVEVVYVSFEYKTSQDYYWAWRNQFYEFSILEFIEKNYTHQDNFLILDADCVITKPVEVLFDLAKNNNGFLSYVIDYDPNKKINGLSRLDMGKVYEELLETKDIQVPYYHAGEFLLCSVSNIKKIVEEFLDLWPKLQDRHQNGLSKFNEEAQTLSFIYFKNGFKGGGANPYIRRVWTNPVFFRDVNRNDLTLSIWHLPAEKQIGFKKLFGRFAQSSFKLDYSEQELLNILVKNLGLFKLTIIDLINYFILTFKNAISKRVRKRIHR